MEIARVFETWIPLSEAKYPLIILTSNLIFAMLVYRQFALQLQEFQLPADKKNTFKRRAVLAFGFVFLAILDVAVLYRSILHLEDIAREDSKKLLHESMRMSERMVKMWQSERMAIIQNHAANTKVLEWVRALVELHNAGEHEQDRDVLLHLRNYYLRVQETLAISGMFVVAPDGVSIASMRDENLHSMNIVATKHPNYFQAALGGLTIMIPPIESDLDIPGYENLPSTEVPPTMFFATPLRDSAGDTIAVLLERYQPSLEFSQVIAHSWYGATGEILFYNQDNKILNLARHPELLDDNSGYAHKSVNILLATTSDLEWSKTNSPKKLAQLSRYQEFEIFSFIDYRKASVYAARHWNDDLNMGMIAKIDIAESNSAQKASMADYVSSMVASILLKLVVLVTAIIFWRKHTAVKQSWNTTQMAAQKNLEQQSALNEAKFELLSQIVPMPIYIKDNDGHYLFCNDHYLKELNATKCEVLCRKDEDLENSDIHPLIQAETDKVTMDNAGTTILTNPNQKNRYFLLSQYKMNKDQYGVDGELSLAIDMSRIYELEQKLEQLSLQAKQAENAKNEFLACMSHELRTPLNSVIGLSRILQNQNKDSKVRHKISMVLQSANHLLNLLNDVLDFSLIDSGDYKENLTDFNLKEMFEDTLKSFAFSAHSKKLTLLLDTSGIEHDYISSDIARVRQLANQLIGNAIKFTSSGEVVVDVSTTSHNDLLLLKCRIKDTGDGIEQEKLTRIFEEFVQGDSSMSRRYEGIGLGLALCKKAAALLNGDISVHSVEGKGSMFKFSVVVGFSEMYLTDEHVPLHFTHSLVYSSNEPTKRILGNIMAKMGISTHPMSTDEETVSINMLPASAALTSAVIDFNVGMETLVQIESTLLSLGIRRLIILVSTTDDTQVLINHNEEFRIITKPFTEKELRHALSL